MAPVWDTIHVDMIFRLRTEPKIYRQENMRNRATIARGPERYQYTSFTADIL